jgi:PKD repeat protein
MNNNWFRAFTLVASLGLGACGGGGGGGGGTAIADTTPIANFALACNDLNCTFTDTSSDADAGDGITYSWNFGDGSPVVTVASPTHAFATPNTYSVALTVTDRFGLKATATRAVTVTAAPAPAAPHANFTVGCTALDCSFTDTSTYDPGSVAQSRSWDFGDNTAGATAASVTHQYAATTLTTYTVKLTITDAAGKVSTSVQSIPVTPPATTSNCVGGGCVLTLTQASKVTATLVSHSCLTHGSIVRLIAPQTQTLFTDGCYDTVGAVVSLNGGVTYAAGTTLDMAVLSGLSGTTALAYTPTIRVSGDFASGWTLTFDDGFGGAGEPDFNDVVVLIKATPSP